MISAQTDALKQQVAAHWDRRAAHFDEDFGHSIRTAAERAARDGILDLILPAGDALEAFDIGCGTAFLSSRTRLPWPPYHRRRFRPVNDRAGPEGAAHGRGRARTTHPPALRRLGRRAGLKLSQTNRGFAMPQSSKHVEHLTPRDSRGRFQPDGRRGT